VSGCVEPFGQRSTFAMYKMMIDVSGEERVFLFRGPGCRARMLEWYYDHLRRAVEDEEIGSIRVWGTVGNKTDILLEWPPAEPADSGRVRYDKRPRSEHRPRR